MAYDIVSGVMREAGRVMADRLLPDRRDRGPYRDYGHDDYDRRRSRSPRPYSSSGSSLGRYGSDSGASMGRRDASPHGDPRHYFEQRRGNDRPRRNESPPRPDVYWSRRYHSPSPTRSDRSRFQDNRPYRDRRRGDRRGSHRGRGRMVQRESNDEDALRRRAVDSRPASKRTIFPPNIMAATRDNWGHPLFPEAEIEDGESTEELAAIREPRDYQANEERRCAIARADEVAGKMYRKVVDVLDPNRVGPWSIATGVVTFVQAVNLLRWVHAGDTFSAEYLKSVQTRLGTDPTLHRTQGEVTLLQHQMDAMRQYNAIVEGTKVARGKITNPGRRSPPRAGAPFQGPAPAPVVLGGPVGPGPLSPAPPDEDEPMPGPTTEAPAEAAAPSNPDPSVPAYLGTSAIADVDTTLVVLTEIGTTDAFARPGMKSSLLKAKKWYTNVPTGHWPKGMRVSHWELPSSTTAVPCDADVRAWFTLNALMPQRGPGGTSIHRARFLDAATRLLSVHGAFHRYAQFGQYVVAHFPFEHYPFDATNISFAQIVAWLVQHGIESQSESVAILESFARARRNHIAGVADVNTLEFADGFPCSLNDVASIVVRDEELWANLRHGSVRPDETTLYPSHPAGDVEMHPLPQQTEEELAALTGDAA
ncbi:hypothetical protein B0H15DRAFT_801516 [Mycena belliarum]|uniref:Uncharacterized protein n=1 Tax=Mycena belliarum TaxID=1033014 RepID=A0AAD6U6W7_9AGAR|nr:hypothetical protein B0H15DRAFT_801516 [Mycena belliae]